MSGTLMIMFEAGETKKVKEWFASVCPTERYPDLPVPVSKYRPADIERGLYVSFNRNIMELDYAIWDIIGSSYATVLAQELTKQFKVKKAGWASVGYCDDFHKSKGFNSVFFRIEGIQGQELEELEKFYKEQAKQLVGNTK